MEDEARRSKKPSISDEARPVAGLCFRRDLRKPSIAMPIEGLMPFPARVFFGVHCRLLVSHMYGVSKDPLARVLAYPGELSIGLSSYKDHILQPRVISKLSRTQCESRINDARCRGRIMANEQRATTSRERQPRRGRARDEMSDQGSSIWRCWRRNRWPWPWFDGRPTLKLRAGRHNASYLLIRID